MSRTKRILLVILVVFIALQFIRPAKNNSGAVQQADMQTHFNVPDSVAGILKTSCYDCHSNNTRYPWYANIQPVGWLLNNHIQEGKKELNFNDFAAYSKRRQASKLRSIQNSVKDGSMPLSSYTLIHSDAKLSETNKALIIEWTSKTIDSLSNKE